MSVSNTYSTLQFYIAAIQLVQGILTANAVIMLLISNVIAMRIFAWNKVIYGTGNMRVHRWGYGSRGEACIKAMFGFICLFVLATYLISMPVT